MQRKATAQKRYTGPMRLPQQTILMSRVPFSAVFGGVDKSTGSSYCASATVGKVTWSVEIPGRPPTQRDRDVIEMLFATVEPTRMDGTIGYRFEAYGFLRKLGYKNPGRRDVTWLRDTLRRWIRPISLRAADGSAWHDFALVSDAQAARLGVGRQARWIVAVVLSPAYLEMLRSNMHLAYHTLVPQISMLPNDLAKGIARTMLGHQSRHRRLDDMLGDLGVRVETLAKRTQSKYRASVLTAAGQLSQLGIRVDEKGPGLRGVSLNLDAQPDGVYTAAPERSPIAELLGLSPRPRHGSTSATARPYEEPARSYEDSGTVLRAS